MKPGRIQCGPRAAPRWVQGGPGLRRVLWGLLELDSGNGWVFLEVAWVVVGMYFVDEFSKILT